MRLGKAHMRWHNYEALKAVYLQYNATPPYQQATYANNEDDALSFPFRAYVMFYIDMYDISNDTTWLDLAFDSVDHVLDNTDKRRSEKGEITVTAKTDPITAGNYYQGAYPYVKDGTPLLGWSSTDGSPSPYLRGQVLQDGQILGYISSLVDYVKDNAITAYITRADDYITFMKTVIDIHAPSWRDGYFKTVDGVPIWVQGTYLYQNVDGQGSLYSSPLAYNHSGGLMQAMLVCHKYEIGGIASYLDKATKFIGFIRDTRQDVEDRFFFQYILTSPTAEDLNHGSYYIVPFIKFAYDNGYLGVTIDEVERYSNSLAYAWRLDKVGSVAERFDGTSANETTGIPDGEAFDVGQMAMLGEFNNDIYSMCRDLLGTRYIANYARQYWGYSSMLRFIPDNIR